MMATIRATGLSHNVPLPPNATIVGYNGSDIDVKQVKTLTPGAYGKVAKFEEISGEKRVFVMKVAVCATGDDFEILVASSEPDKQNLAAEIAPGAVDKVIAKARQTLPNGQEWIAMMVPFHPWDLKTFLIEKGPSLTHQERIQILIDVAGALRELNKNGFIHCDIKAVNIFIDNWGRIRIGDHGIASPMPQKGEERLFTGGNEGMGYERRLDLFSETPEEKPTDSEMRIAFQKMFPNATKEINLHDKDKLEKFKEDHAEVVYKHFDNYTFGILVICVMVGKSWMKWLEDLQPKTNTDANQKWLAGKIFRVADFKLTLEQATFVAKVVLDLCTANLEKRKGLGDFEKVMKGYPIDRAGECDKDDYPMPKRRKRID